MIYAFNEKKEKVDFVIVTGDVTINAGTDVGMVTFVSQQLINFGFKDGNPNNYILVGIEQKQSNSANWSQSPFVYNGAVYPRVTPTANNLTLSCYTNSTSDQDRTFNVRAVFMKVA